MDEKKYLPIWKKYLPVIRLHLKKSLNEDQQFKLNAIDFEQAGNRSKAGYTFSLQIENGKVINNISGSAVARDLFEAVKEDDAIRGMLLNRSIKVSLNSAAVLSIKNTYISKFK